MAVAVQTSATRVIGLSAWCQWFCYGRAGKSEINAQLSYTHSTLPLSVAQPLWNQCPLWTVVGEEERQLWNSNLICSAKRTTIFKCPSHWKGMRKKTKKYTCVSHTFWTLSSMIIRVKKLFSSVCKESSTHETQKTSIYEVGRIWTDAPEGTRFRVLRIRPLCHHSLFSRMSSIDDFLAVNFVFPWIDSPTRQGFNSMWIQLVERDSTSPVSDR